MKLDLFGKIFLASLGAWVVGKATQTKIRGSKEEIHAVAGALMSSRKFQDALSEPGATIDNVMQRMYQKNMSAEAFERTFGIKWPL